MQTLFAFVGTNIDDILVLMVLLAQAGNRKARVAAGYALGVAALTACAMVVGAGLSAIPGGWLRWLGLVPVALGVKAWFGKDDDSAPEAASMLGVALITVGNGGDNLGVYVPLFAGCSAQELAAAAATFAVMTAVWLALAARLASLPALKRLIETRSRILVPAIYILLGLYILFF